MERTIDEVARLTGLSTRTLRHWGEVGLLAPSSTGAGGRRRYDEVALVRLQRILLLRELGLGLAAIADVLDGGEPPVAALQGHLEALRVEELRLRRRIRAVEATVRSLQRGDPLMAEEMFDGFDHAAHRDEVAERWGADAWARSDRWWRTMSPDERAGFQERMSALQADWRDAAARAIRPDSREAQALADRHVEWLAGIPGTPQSAEYARGLGEMYVLDDRFGAHYGGRDGALFVRDALAVWADAAHASDASAASDG